MSSVVAGMSAILQGRESLLRFGVVERGVEVEGGSAKVRFWNREEAVAVLAALGCGVKSRSLLDHMAGGGGSAG
jgi:hypothetical protein